MGIKRIVDTDFWTDDKVVDMFSPEDKLFMLYLLTNPHTTQLGIYPLNRKIVAFEIGYSLETINVLLDRFENKYNIIRYSPDTSEVAVRNYLRHSIIKGGKPVEDLLIKEIRKVKNRDLLRYVCDELNSHEDLNETVRKVLNTVNDNDNDNDNDVSLYDSSNDSLHESSKKPVKHKYGEFGHVMLSDADMAKLKEQFPDYERRIKTLDEYLENNPRKHYANHYLTIRNWARKDAIEEPKAEDSEIFKKAVRRLNK